jgi:hypothetical protein
MPTEPFGCVKTQNDLQHIIIRLFVRFRGVAQYPDVSCRESEWHNKRVTVLSSINRVYIRLVLTAHNNHADGVLNGQDNNWN